MLKAYGVAAQRLYNIDYWVSDGKVTEVVKLSCVVFAYLRSDQGTAA